MSIATLEAPTTPRLGMSDAQCAEWLSGYREALALKGEVDGREKARGMLARLKRKEAGGKAGKGLGMRDGGRLFGLREVLGGQ